MIEELQKLLTTPQTHVVAYLKSTTGSSLQKALHVGSISEESS